MDIYYCGFNGFSQVSSRPETPTLTELTPQSEGIPSIRDVSICWNFLALVKDSGVLFKHGLGMNSLDRRTRSIPLPGGGKILCISATPRHLLAVTEEGETWSHEEGKGWRPISVHAERDPLMPEEPPIKMIKTSCGDNYNLGLDSRGRVYSLPSRLDFRPKVKDISCGKEHNLLLTEDGELFSWGGGSRGQLGHGLLSTEVSPRRVTALEGIVVTKIAAGGWHSAVITADKDLYTFGWNESGQLAQATNLAKPAECFSAVEKLFMACCTMQPEDATIPRGEDVYRKPDESEEIPLSSVIRPKDLDTLMSCYNATSCNGETDLVVVQAYPMPVTFPGKDINNVRVSAVSCGSRHTLVLTEKQSLWAFGWNKYGQLGLGDTAPRDSACRVPLPKDWDSDKVIRSVICGDWGTAILVASQEKEKHSK